MSLLVNIAAEFTGKKAFKDADYAVNKLNRGVKKLGAAIGVSLSASAIAAFGRASVKAFSEDELAATRLAKVVDNLGLSFANTEITQFIKNLESSAMVSDDELRPAFQALITTTGSLTNSQKLLTQAIDISKGSGVGLTEVAQDLANAYVGNVKGLKKYNLGLTQAELKASSFEEIMSKLNGQFSGSNAAFLETYAGKMAALQVAADNAKETIGKGLVNALQDVFGAADITELIGKIDILAQKTSNMIDELAWKWKKFWFATSDKAILSSLLPFNNYLQSGLAKIDAEKSATLWKRAMEKGAGFGPDYRSPAGVNSAKMTAAELAAKKRAQELAAAQKAQTKALKDQATLKKAGSIFDLAQIQIIAALKGKLSDEERKRLELQLALETDNVAEAQKLTLEIAKSQGLTDSLAKTLASLPAAQNPFAAWKGYLDEVELQAKRIASMGTSGTQGGSVTTNAIPVPNFELPPVGTYGTPNGPVQGPIVVKVELDGKQIQESVQNQNNQGNGAYFPRLGSSMYAL